MKNIAALPKSLKVRALSNPELVRIIRKYEIEAIQYKLTHNGKEHPFVSVVLKTALTEAKRRHLTIHDPENQQ